MHGQVEYHWDQLFKDKKHLSSGYYCIAAEHAHQPFLLCEEDVYNQKALRSMRVCHPDAPPETLVFWCQPCAWAGEASSGSAHAFSGTHVETLAKLGLNSKPLLRRATTLAGGADLPTRRTRRLSELSVTSAEESASAAEVSRLAVLTKANTKDVLTKSTRQCAWSPCMDPESMAQLFSAVDLSFCPSLPANLSCTQQPTREQISGN